jgi:hypothetical protein
MGEYEERERERERGGGERGGRERERDWEGRSPATHEWSLSGTLPRYPCKEG